MFRPFILFLSFVFGAFVTYTQADTLNQLDSNGKKMGWWITYLNGNLEVLNDSNNATHCMYNYYVKDNYTYRFGEGYGSKKHPILFPKADSLKLGDHTLLNGKYRTEYKNGKVRSEITALHGILISFKKYDSNGILRLEILYEKDCGAPQRHCLKEYKKDGSLKFEGFTWVPGK